MAKKTSMEQKKRRAKFRRKYNLSIVDENNFATIFTFRLSIMNVFTVLSALAIILIFIVYLVIAYTPLKEYIIPNYPVMEEREKLEHNAELVDSLEYQMKQICQRSDGLEVVMISLS